MRQNGSLASQGMAPSLHGWREFFASVIGDLLSWPIAVFVLALILIDPIRKLLGRVKTAKGFGGEIEFVESIKDAEENADRAIDESSDYDDSPGTLESAGEPSGDRGAPAEKPGATRDATPTIEPKSNSDPSGSILQAWESLVKALAALGRVNAGRGRPAKSPTAIIEQVRKTKQLPDSFFDAVESLREARNQVAHGEVEPTEGAAHTYVERSHQLEAIAEGARRVASMDLGNPLL